MSTHRFLLVAGTIGLAAGGLLLGDQAYLRVKGWVAGRLIARSWSARLADGRAHRPWSWADFEPVARLQVPRLHVERMVLAGATGSAMAFGLGHLSGSALPGSPSTGSGQASRRIAIAGHRDRWARFLRDLRVGDELTLETPGRTDRFEVVSLEVLSRDRIDVLDPAASGTTLVLITCFPFDDLLPSPRRWVVSCRSLEA